MDKIKPDTHILSTWVRTYTGPYVLSCKLDGVSGMYVCGSTHKDSKLYTRGNGAVGQDISHLIKYLRLPAVTNTVVRGEFIMSKTVFNTKYSSAFANARNLVAGTINRNTVTDIINDIDFVAYEVIEPSLKPSEQMAFLKTAGFNVVQYDTHELLSNETLSEILINWRTTYKYEIDGIIVANDAIYPRTTKNPEHAFAFKMVLSDQMAEAKVVDVLWTASKDGYLKPRVQIEPIQLSGVKIEYATGFNAAFIKSNNIGVGALIQIIRSGDVIPHIRSVIQPATEAKMPNVPYKWNKTNVDIILEDLESDETVIAKNITGFFRGIEVDGLSAGNVGRIMKAGFDSVPKILKMTIAEFKTVDGFKEKMATKLHDNIRDKIGAASLDTIMAASNIFGRGFSDKRIQLILENYPDVLTSSISDAAKIDKLAKIKGMSHKTAELFVQHIPHFITFINDCELTRLLNRGARVDGVGADGADGVAAAVVKDTSHPLYNKSIVMSGMRDKELEKMITNVGGNISSAVSSKTFAVVTPEPDSDTGKVSNARKLGVSIYTPETFRSTFFK